MIVLDTHVWLWFISDSSKLSTKAARVINEVLVENNNLIISSISVWEVALLVRKQRLRLTMPVQDWIAKSEALPFIRFVPVNNRIAVKSVDLPSPLHDDPADRIVIATTLTEGVSLVTKDRKIIDCGLVRTIW